MGNIWWFFPPSPPIKAPTLAPTMAPTVRMVPGVSGYPCYYQAASNAPPAALNGPFVYLYDYQNYGGECHALTAGDYGWLNFFDDRTMSLATDPNCQAVGYQHPSWTGWKMVNAKSGPLYNQGYNFRNDGWGDQMSSISVFCSPAGTMIPAANKYSTTPPDFNQWGLTVPCPTGTWSDFGQDCSQICPDCDPSARVPIIMASATLAQQAMATTAVQSANILLQRNPPSDRGESTATNQQALATTALNITLLNQEGNLPEESTATNLRSSQQAMVAAEQPANMFLQNEELNPQSESIRTGNSTATNLRSQQAQSVHLEYAKCGGSCWFDFTPVDGSRSSHVLVCPQSCPYCVNILCQSSRPDEQGVLLASQKPVYSVDSFFLGQTEMDAFTTNNLGYNVVFVRKCSDCQPSHQYILYKRLTAYPAGFSLYDLFFNQWTSVNNVLNVDFELYSLFDDYIAGRNKWQYSGNVANLPQQDADKIAFPGDCSPSYPVRWQWNSASLKIHTYKFYAEVVSNALPLKGLALTTSGGSCGPSGLNKGCPGSQCCSVNGVCGGTSPNKDQTYCTQLHYTNQYVGVSDGLYDGIKPPVIPDISDSRIRNIINWIGHEVQVRQVTLCTRSIGQGCPHYQSNGCGVGWCTNTKDTCANSILGAIFSVVVMAANLMTMGGANALKGANAAARLGKLSAKISKVVNAANEYKKAKFAWNAAKSQLDKLDKAKTMNEWGTKLFFASKDAVPDAAAGFQALVPEYCYGKVTGEFIPGSPNYNRITVAWAVDLMKAIGADAGLSGLAMDIAATLDPTGILGVIQTFSGQPNCHDCNDNLPMPVA